MEALAARLVDQAIAYSTLEIVAVVFAIAYLLLAIRQNIWCWLCAGISTAIYIWLFIAARLYMESMLNVFYFGMAIYGWMVWSRGRADSRELPVTVWAWRRHAMALGVIAIVNRQVPEEPAAPAVTVAEVTPTIDLNMEAAMLTAPLQQELEDLQSDLKKAEEKVKRDIGL